MKRSTFNVQRSTLNGNRGHVRNKLTLMLRSPGILWAAGAVLLWSQSAACLKFVLTTTPWLTVALWSSAVSAIVYGIAVATTGSASRLWAMPARELAWFAGLGLVGYFLYNCLIYVAYASGPASEVLIVNYVWPVATVGFAALIVRERPSFREIGGLGLALLGVSAVITRGRWQWPQALGADLLALGAALSYGLYSAVSKRLGGDRRVALFLAFTSASACFALVALLTRAPLWIPASTTRWLVVYHGIAIGAVPALFWLKALAAGRTPHLAAFVYLTPVLGLLWLTALFASEPITVWLLLGLGLIVAGFLVLFPTRIMAVRTPTPPLERIGPS